MNDWNGDPDYGCGVMLLLLFATVVGFALGLFVGLTL